MRKIVVTIITVIAAISVMMTPVSAEDSASEGSIDINNDSIV